MPQLVLAICLPAFQQLSGINAIMFYSTQIFETLGHGNDVAVSPPAVRGVY